MPRRDRSAGPAAGEFRCDRALANHGSPGGNAAIDARSVLPNGVAINGPVELSDAVGQPSGDVRAGLTEKLMMYALNRELEYFDMPQVRAVVRAAAKDNYKLSSIVRGIVNTEAFRKQVRQKNDLVGAVFDRPRWRI